MNHLLHPGCIANQLRVEQLRAGSRSLRRCKHNTARAHLHNKRFKAFPIHVHKVHRQLCRATNGVSRPRSCQKTKHTRGQPRSRFTTPTRVKTITSPVRTLRHRKRGTSDSPYQTDTHRLLCRFVNVPRHHHSCLQCHNLQASGTRLGALHWSAAYAPALVALARLA